MFAEWVVFYTNGESFSSLDGEPWEAPRDYVQCIAMAHEMTGHHMLAEQDFYCWHFEDEVWVPHDQNGLFQYLRLPGDRKVVLCGYWVKRERYGAIRSAAHKDPRLPPVFGKLPPGPDGE